MKHKKLEIIFEDDNIIVVNKPAGLLSIPDRFDDELPNLTGQLKKMYAQVFVVHRLDRDTSGLILFAKTAEAHKKLSLDFQNHLITKYYDVLVHGRLNELKGTIEKPLDTQNKKVVVSKKGKPSISHYEVIEEFKFYTYLKAHIITGRTHQIRVHFSAIGHPLMVDEKYGRSSSFFLSELIGRRYKKLRDDVERPLMHRTSLHSKTIIFKHPISKEKMTFEASLPKDFRAVLNQLRKHNKIN